MKIKIPLNSRQRRIILTLLNASKPMPARTIAGQLSLTPRIIRYNMNRARPWLESVGAEYQSVRGAGLFIDAPDLTRSQLMSLFRDQDECDVYLSSEQRTRLLLLWLLTSKTPIAASSLAERLGVSRSTVFQDIERADEFIQQFGMRMQRRPRLGLWLEGEENARRVSLMRLLQQELSRELWSTLWTFEMSKDLQLLSDTPEFVDFLLKLELPFSRMAVERAERALSAVFTLGARISLQVYIALAIHAMKVGMFILEIPQQLVEVDTIEKKISELIITEVANTFALDIPDAEVDILCARIHSVQMMQPATRLFTSSAEVEAPSSETYQLAKDIAALLAIYIHPWLRVDAQFIQGLAIHLGPKVSSLQAGFGSTIRCMRRSRKPIRVYFRSF